MYVHVGLVRVRVLDKHGRRTTAINSSQERRNRSVRLLQIVVDHLDSHPRDRLARLCAHDQHSSQIGPVFAWHRANLVDLLRLSIESHDRRIRLDILGARTAANRNASGHDQFFLHSSSAADSPEQIGEESSSHLPQHRSSLSVRRVHLLRCSRLSTASASSFLPGVGRTTEEALASHHSRSLTRCVLQKNKDRSSCVMRCLWLTFCKTKL